MQWSLYRLVYKYTIYKDTDWLKHHSRSEATEARNMKCVKKKSSNYVTTKKVFFQNSTPGIIENRRWRDEGKLTGKTIEIELILGGFMRAKY